MIEWLNNKILNDKLILYDEKLSTLSKNNLLVSLKITAEILFLA